MNMPENTQPLLYHRSQQLYERGDRVAPGNCGRLILGIGPSHNCFYREYLLEKIRQLEFPDKPSRMKAAFAFVTFDFAKTWKRGNIVEYVFAVRIADQSALLHKGDMNWIDAMGEFRSFSGVEDCARHYWRGDERCANTWEIVTSGEFTIEDRLTSIAENGVKP